GKLGQVDYVLHRQDEHGVTLVGRRLLETVDPSRLDHQIAAADLAGVAARDRRGGAPSPPGLRWYAVLDHRRHAPSPFRRLPGRGGSLPDNLDGDLAPWAVVSAR